VPRSGTTRARQDASVQLSYRRQDEHQHADLGKGEIAAIRRACAVIESRQAAGKSPTKARSTPRPGSSTASWTTDGRDLAGQRLSWPTPCPHDPFQLSPPDTSRRAPFGESTAFAPDRRSSQQGRRIPVLVGGAAALDLSLPLETPHTHTHTLNPNSAKCFCKRGFRVAIKSIKSWSVARSGNAGHDVIHPALGASLHARCEPPARRGRPPRGAARVEQKSTLSYRNGNALPPEVVESSRKKAFGVAEKRQPTATLGHKVRQLNT